MFNDHFSLQLFFPCQNLLFLNANILMFGLSKCFSLISNCILQILKVWRILLHRRFNLLTPCPNYQARMTTIATKTFWKRKMALRKEMKVLKSTTKSKTRRKWMIMQSQCWKILKKFSKGSLGKYRSVSGEKWKQECQRREIKTRSPPSSIKTPTKPCSVRSNRITQSLHQVRCNINKLTFFQLLQTNAK